MDDFYKELKPLKEFKQILEKNNFKPLPINWWIVVTDIRGSTSAVKAGRYQEVNLIGAASISAMLNAADGADLPFVFGGDGATMLIPESIIEPVKKSLAALSSMSAEYFGLELRVGLVSMREVAAAGKRLQVAKLEVDKNYQQAILNGDGIAFAEKLIKDPATTEKHTIPANKDESVSLNGLECRWQDITSPKEEVVTLIVSAKSDDSYSAVLHTIEEIYGNTSEHHPIRLHQLHLQPLGKGLKLETKLKTTKNSILGKFFIFQSKKVTTAIAKFFNKVGLFGWRKYHEIVLQTTDYRKFDGMLRMVIAGNAKQRQNLEHELRLLEARNEIKYGISVSAAAHLTCLVFDRHGRQVHFVDGAGGGYTLAAKELKNKL